MPMAWISPVQLAILAFVPVAAAIHAGESQHLRGAISSQPAEDACRCINWRDVYELGQECGTSGPEYWSAEKMRGVNPTAKQEIYGKISVEWCEKFYTRFPEMNNFCANHDFLNASDGQWCYVSGECGELNRGRRISSALSWKMCSPGNDTLLSEKTPEQLMGFFKVADYEMNMGVLLKNAYPIWPVARWPEVKSFFDPGTVALHQSAPQANRSAVDATIRHFLKMDARDFRGNPEGGDDNPMAFRLTRVSQRELQRSLQRLIESGKPTIIDSFTGHPPFMVVAGPKLYRLSFVHDVPNAFWAPGFMKGELTKLTCVRGCGEAGTDYGEPENSW